MDIIDRNRIRNHPAAVLARRATERRQAKPATVQPKAPTTRAELISAIERAWPQACPHDNLQDALMARFGKNRLDMLDDDMLRRVRLAIAM